MSHRFPLATRKEIWDRRRKHNEQKAAQLEKERNQNLVDYLKRRDTEAKQFEEREAKKLEQQEAKSMKEVKKLAEIILDDAAIGHDLGDKIELVRCVGEKLLPDLVTGRERFLVLIFQPVADGVFVALVEHARDIEFRHAMRPEIGGMPFHMFLDKGEESEHVALRKEVQKRVAGDDGFRHDFTLPRRPTGRAADPSGPA